MDNLTIQNLSKEFLQTHITEFLDIISDGLNEYWGEKEFLYDLPEKWNSSITLIIQNSIVGFIISSRKTDCFHIHKFYIHRLHRKSGYGDLLLGEFQKRIKQKYNCNTICLKVYKENDKAIKFYKKHSFIEIEEQNSLLLLKTQI